MNNFHAVGRIAAEIKLQKNEKGVVYTRFPLAISRGKNKDGENRGTDFPMITVFEKQAENLQKYSGKGKRVAIEAHIQTRNMRKMLKYAIPQASSLIGSNTLTGKIKTITWMQQMIIIMMTVAFLDMNMRTRGTFSKCFMWETTRWELLLY